MENENARLRNEVQGYITSSDGFEQRVDFYPFLSLPNWNEQLTCRLIGRTDIVLVLF